MKLICVDLDAPLPTVPPCSHGEQWVLLRLHGHPIGLLYPPAEGCAPRELGRLALENHGWAIAQHLVGDRLAAVGSVDDLSSLGQACPRRAPAARLHVTVAVCTRNRASQLRECLDALAALEYPADLLGP